MRSQSHQLKLRVPPPADERAGREALSSQYPPPWPRFRYISSALEWPYHGPRAAAAHPLAIQHSAGGIRDVACLQRISLCQKGFATMHRIDRESWLSDGEERPSPALPAPSSPFPAFYDGKAASQRTHRRRATRSPQPPPRRRRFTRQLQVLTGLTLHSTTRA